jgi:hypothetical protein
MNISENISYILEPSVSWQLFTNRSYAAKIQKANPDRLYNTDQPGIVYNILEDSYAPVGNGYVVTGLLGEMWPIGERAVGKYEIAKENITDTPQTVMTKENGVVLAGVQIPKEMLFRVQTDYGERVWLNGNREGIDHKEGDWVLVATKIVDGKYVPDFADAGRIVNGAIMEQLYRRI